MYGLDVRREPAVPYAPEEVVRYFRCEALEVAEKLIWFVVAHLLLHEGLTDAFLARGGQPPHQLRLQCLLRLSLRPERNDVFHNRCMPMIKLRHGVVKLGPLDSDGCRLKLRLLLSDQSAGRSGQKGGRRTATVYIAAAGVLSEDS
jgi:hypothetical protein